MHAQCVGLLNSQITIVFRDYVELSFYWLKIAARQVNINSIIESEKYENKKDHYN